MHRAAGDASRHTRQVNPVRLVVPRHPIPRRAERQLVRHRRVIAPHIRVDPRVGVPEHAPIGDRQMTRCIHRTRAGRVNPLITPRHVQVVQRHVVRILQLDRVVPRTGVPPVQQRTPARRQVVVLTQLRTVQDLVVDRHLIHLTREQGIAREVVLPQIVAGPRDVRRNTHVPRTDHHTILIDRRIPRAVDRHREVLPLVQLDHIVRDDVTRPHRPLVHLQNQVVPVLTRQNDVVARLPVPEVEPRLVVPRGERRRVHPALPCEPTREVRKTVPQLHRPRRTIQRHRRVRIRRQHPRHTLRHTPLIRPVQTVPAAVHRRDACIPQTVIRRRTVRTDLRSVRKARRVVQTPADDRHAAGRVWYDDIGWQKINACIHIDRITRAQRIRLEHRADGCLGMRRIQPTVGIATDRTGILIAGGGAVIHIVAMYRRGDAERKIAGIGNRSSEFRDSNDIVCTGCEPRGGDRPLETTIGGRNHIRSD